MPTIQVTLSDDLHKALKRQGLNASKLLQDRIRAELRRRQLLELTDEYLGELISEVGGPDLADRTRAEAIARRLSHRAESICTAAEGDNQP